MVARPQTASNCEVVGVDELVRLEMLRVEDNNKCAHDSEARESTIRSLGLVGQRLPFSAAPALPVVISVSYCTLRASGGAPYATRFLLFSLLTAGLRRRIGPTVPSLSSESVPRSYRAKLEITSFPAFIDSRDAT